MAKMKPRWFFPDERKLLVSIAFAIVLWVFPLVTSSVYAKPFVEFSSFWLGLLINLVVAYVLGCLVVSFWKRKKIVAIIVVAFILLFVLVPKVSFYSVGDIGGVDEKYCQCYGLDRSLSECCNSFVSYCHGPCLRSERTRYWETPTRSPEQIACEEQGGVWGAHSRFSDKESCILPTSDAGTPCTDSSQCEGMCIGPGACSKWDRLPSGCYEVLTEGVPGGLCID